MKWHERGMKKPGLYTKGPLEELRNLRSLRGRMQASLDGIRHFVDWPCLVHSLDRDLEGLRVRIAELEGRA